MPPLETLGLIVAYFGIGTLALYLQYRSHLNALAKVVAAHEAHLKDLEIMITVLQSTLEIRQKELQHWREEA